MKKFTADQIDFGLQIVRAGLAAGEIKHNPKPTNLGDVPHACQAIRTPVFNQGYSMIQAECGTVGCIGGWLGVILRLTPFEVGTFVHAPYNYVNARLARRLERLFWPKHLRPMKNITAIEAIDAIDRFRAGKQPWVLVACTKQAPSRLVGQRAVRVPL